MIPSEIPLIGYKKILYTTGLREQSRFAFHHAASLSKAYQAQLTVFHVLPGDDEKFSSCNIKMATSYLY